MRVEVVVADFEEISAAHEICIKLLVLNAAKNAKFHLSQAKASQSSAETAIGRRRNSNFLAKTIIQFFYFIIQPKNLYFYL